MALEKHKRWPTVRRPISQAKYSVMTCTNTELDTLWIWNLAQVHAQ